MGFNSGFKGLKLIHTHTHSHTGLCSYPAIDRFQCDFYEYVISLRYLTLETWKRKRRKFILQINLDGGKGKTTSVQAWRGPEGSRRLRLPDFKTLGTWKLVRLSTLRTGLIYPTGNIPGTNFRRRLSQPQGHSEAGRIMAVKNSNDTIGNRTRDLPSRSSVHQPIVSHLFSFFSQRTYCIFFTRPVLTFKNRASYI